MRTGGNAANGAGFDSGIAGSGTDYSTQDASQLTLSDIACSNNTTVTSATGGFTTLMIGNAIRITGGGSTTGYYWITARASTNSITVDRTPGTVSGGSGRVGGACTGDPGNLAAHVVAGNIVYLRATAGNAASYPTSSLDYTIAAYSTPTSGSQAVGWVRWVGENGIPTISTPGTAFYNCIFQSFEGLYLVANNNTIATLGMINSGGSVRILNSILNLNLQTGCAGLYGATLTVEGTEVYGGGTSPTASAGCFGIHTENYNCTIRSSNIHHCRDHGIDDVGSGTTVVGSKIWRNVGNGIQAGNVAASIASILAGNTVDGNGGHGINVSGTAGIPCYEIVNNNITNQVGSGKYGINLADGTLAVNDRRKRFVDYNNVYNNTSNYNAITAGTHDLSVDPGYTAVSTGDFTPANALLQAAL